MVSLVVGLAVGFCETVVAQGIHTTNPAEKQFDQIKALIKNSVCINRGEGFSYIFKSSISEDFIFLDYACPRKLRIKTMGALIPNMEFVTNGNEAWRAIPEFPADLTKTKAVQVEHYWTLQDFDFALLLEIFPALTGGMAQPFQLDQSREARERAISAHQFKFLVKDGYQWIELKLAEHLMPPHKLLFKFSILNSELLAIDVDIHKHLEHLKFERTSFERNKKFPEIIFNPSIEQDDNVTYYPKRK